MDLKVGMTVRQRKNSPLYYQSKELIGKITRTSFTGWHTVVWSNGYTNSYEQEHLEVVDYCNNGQLMLIQEV